MNRDQYLSQPEVIDFMNWLAELIEKPNGFTHSYLHKKSKRTFEFNSVYNAYEKYEWNSKSYIDNTRLLNEFRASLLESIVKEDSNALGELMQRVVKWGGVKGNTVKGNLYRINSIVNKVNYLRLASSLLNLETIDLSRIEEINNSELLISAGFTKIYAVLIDNFIIYDSRVGAALCLFVRKYLESQNMSLVPESLGFSWAPIRKSSSKRIECDKSNVNRRDPSKGILKFRKFDSNKRVHWKDNIRSSWLISNVASRTRFADNSSKADSPSRRLEAALFMIGYDVNNGVDK